MKKYILFASLVVLFSLGCREDFLDRTPIDQISSAVVFEDEALANAFLNNILGTLPSGQYNGNGGGYGNNYLLSSITDNSRSKSGWVRSNSIIRVGAWNPSNTGNSGLDIWGEAYSAIRKTNNFVENLEAGSLSATFKEAATAKARFVRAWFYFDLARRYGAVPLITTAQSLDDPDLLASQTPRAEVYNFVVSELNAISSSLPTKSEAKAGEITKQAALGLAARTLLFAKDYSAAATMANRLITGGDKDNLALASDYGQLFLSTGGDPEAVYEILSLPPDRSHQFDRGNWPVRWRNDNGGQTCPTQELIDKYEMANGLPITDANSGYDPASPYTGRDPRFYATIFYHGAEFSEVAPSRGEPFIDMEWNAFNEGPGEQRDGNASISGYLVRKFADPSLGFAPEGVSKTSWLEIRYAEILLIFAEAENEANGPSEAVYSALNQIRARAGMPDLGTGLSQDEMREAIIQERRIELAFENHRWFDLIRWDMAETVLNATFHGMRIDRKTIPAAADGGPMHVFDPAELTFTVFPMSDRTHIFPNSNMLAPIPQGEIDANPNLNQNPGY